jgi:uncharacterized protein (DUF433 family)
MTATARSGTSSAFGQRLGRVAGLAAERAGRACLKGTRISVLDIVGLHQQGLRPEEMLDVYMTRRPLTLADIHAAPGVLLRPQGRAGRGGRRRPEALRGRPCRTGDARPRALRPLSAAFPIFTDECVDGRFVKALRLLGWDVLHATDVFGEHTDDEVLFGYAAEHHRVFVSGDAPAQGIANRWPATRRLIRGVVWSAELARPGAIGPLIAQRHHLNPRR